MSAHSCIQIDELCELLATYLESQQIDQIRHAYAFSANAHKGQFRISGEPYIQHPLAVAHILANMYLDVTTLSAALLHDVIEDTGISKEELAIEFNEQVAELVDGVSKLTLMEGGNRELVKMASFRKMLMAMTKDIRVIIVKLADRLHNMRTLNVMKSTSRHRIAKETLEIYAPLASRLGMNNMRIQLEDLCFAALYPLRYKVISHRLTTLCHSHQRIEHFSTIQNSIQQKLKQRNINAKVFRRERHVYSIYYKMREKKKDELLNKRPTFSEATKLYSFQIVIDSIEESIDQCYRILGIVHNLYKPIDGSFHDYIAIPKLNGYQSLHTLLISPYAVPLEIQIRTANMHEQAEFGIVAYGALLFKGKSDSNNNTDLLNHARQRTREWIKNLLELPQDINDSADFFDQFKRDLFPNEVYVFTPKGKIKQLPKDATALDFAYAIHSDIGNHAIGAKIDSQYMSLSTRLVSGQTVEIIIAELARPSPRWLDFAVTARARNHIRNFLKNLKYEDAILLGKRMLDKELSHYQLSIDKLNNEQRAKLIDVFKLSNINQLLANVGLGNLMALVVARQFDHTHEHTEESRANNLIIKGTEGAVVTFSRCCRPIPGDEIVGFISADRGIVIHTLHCKQLLKQRYSPEKWLSVVWEQEVNREFLVDIRIDVRNQRGVLAKVATAITDMNSNIESVSNDNRDGITSTLKLSLWVKNRTHLAEIMRYIKRLNEVTRIQRTKT